MCPIEGRTQLTGEYDVKGALIAKFAQFITWPDNAFEGPTSPLVVCVEGDGPLQSGLAASINQSHVGLRPLRARRFTRESPCHILFVGVSDRKRLVELVGSVDDRTVTVGEQIRFLESGGAIEFRLDGSRLQFAVNLAVIARAKYRISSHLLALARKDAVPEVQP